MTRLPHPRRTHERRRAANDNFKHGFSLAVRPEYIKSSGSVTTNEANLLGYGPEPVHSPYRDPDLGEGRVLPSRRRLIVHLTNFVTGSDAGFGIGGTNTNQVRGGIEAGFLF